MNRAEQIVSVAEKALAALAGEAAGSQHYEIAGVLIDAARQIKCVSAKILAESPTEQQDAPVKVIIAANSLPAEKPTPSKSLRGKKTMYPRFLREGDTLVKIGWSKAEKAEYEHKSPHRILTILLPALAKAGVGGKRFTMSKVLPVLDPEDNTELPEYQVYLCLAWARSVGLVVQHGRQGYSLSKSGELSRSAEALWQQLSSR